MHISLPSIPASQLTAPTIVGPDSAGGSFADAIGSAISSAIGHVEGAQSQAQSAASDLLLDGKGDVHTVALAAQSAELTMELFQQVRNKFVSAYQEIMKMPM